MSWWLLFPFIGALAGWLVMSVAVNAQRIGQKRKESIDRQLSKLVAEQFISFDDIEQQVISPSSLQKILPAIEGHIDEFLRHKLGKSIPMLSMFIGDKTINQLKAVFMEELAELFPKVMKKYLGQLQQEIDLEGVLYAKLAEIPAQRFEATAKSLLAKEFQLIKMMGAVTGFIVGLIQLVMAWSMGLMG